MNNNEQEQININSFAFPKSTRISYDPVTETWTCAPKETESSVAQESEDEDFGWIRSIEPIEGVPHVLDETEEMKLRHIDYLNRESQLLPDDYYLNFQ